MAKSIGNRLSKIIPDPLTDIETLNDTNTIKILDKINGNRVSINQTALEIIETFDGKITLREIANSIAKKYNISIERAEEDVSNLYAELDKNHLVLSKGTFKYWYVRLFYALLGIFVKEVRSVNDKSTGNRG